MDRGVDRDDGGEGAAMRADPLRRRPARAVALALAAFACAVLLVAGGPDYPFRSLQAAWNLGHVLAFFLWTELLLRVSGRFRRLGFPAQIASVAAAALLGGLLIELVQLRLGRSFDAFDIACNLLGGFAALAFRHPSHRLPPSARNGCRLLAAAGLAAALAPLATALLDEIRAGREFPRLGDFEHRLELSRWSGTARFERAAGAAATGRHALRIELGTERYSGVFLEHFPGDWRDRRQLRFAVFLASTEPLDLHALVFDRRHRANGRHYRDRFNNVYPLVPGWNRIAIDLRMVAAAPADRRTEMDDIACFGIFAVNLPRPTVLFLDDLRLE